MKLHHLTTTCLAAGILFCGTTSAQAGGSPVILQQHAQTLVALASGMEDTFREDLQEKHLSTRADRRFLNSLCTLGHVTGQFAAVVQRCARPCELERAFEAVEDAFESAAEHAQDVSACPVMSGLMAQFTQQMNCLAGLDFGALAAVPPVSGHPDHAHAGDDDAGAIHFRIPLPRGLPFLFRQPMDDR